MPFDANTQPAKPAFWDADAALKSAFDKIDAAAGPRSGKWRPLSEDARGFGPAKFSEDR